MSHSIVMKAGHTWPIIEATLDLPGNMSLSGATVRFVLNDTLRNPIFDKPAVIVDAATRAVKYEWAPGDTDRPGKYYGEFYVVRPDGKITGAPNTGYLDVAIYPALSRGP